MPLRFCVGLVISYPDIDDSTRVGEQRPCHGGYQPGCRIFHVPREDSSKATEVAIDEWKDADAGDAKDQVMIFKYKGRFVAVNHVREATCPQEYKCSSSVGHVLVLNRANVYRNVPIHHTHCPMEHLST